MSAQAFCQQLDGDMYRAGATWEEDGVKCTPLQFMGMEAKKEGIWPEDAELERRTKQLLKTYNVDETETNRIARAREHAAHKWIMDTYFHEYGLETEGPLAASVEKAFSVVPGELSVFPFFWDNIIVEGLMAMPLIDVLVAVTENINSGTAVHAQMNESAEDRTMGEVGEFTSFQEFNISSTESTVRLKEFGAQITISDQAMRRARLPVFERGYARFGRQMGIDITDFCIETIINGDAQWGGVTGVAPTVPAAVAGSPAYLDYVGLLLNFDIGYEPTDVIFGRKGLIKLLNVPQFQDPLAGFKMQSEGVLPRPFGLQTHRWDATKSSGWTAAGVPGDSTKVIAIQRERLLILYSDGGIRTEQDRDARSRSTVVITNWNLVPAIADANSVRVGTGYA